MSEKEGPVCDGLTVIGTSGAIDDVPGSDGTQIYRFHTARGEPYVSKLQRNRDLGRRLLAELTSEKEAPSLRGRPQLRTPNSLPCVERLSEITILPTDRVRVIGEDGQAFPAGTTVRLPHGVHVVPMHQPQSPNLMAVEPTKGSASSSPSSGAGRTPIPHQTSLIAITRGRPTSTPVFCPRTHDKAGIRQRTLVKASATLSETCWEGRHPQWLVETKLDLSPSGVSKHIGTTRIMGLCLFCDSGERSSLLWNCWRVGLGWLSPSTSQGHGRVQ